MAHCDNFNFTDNLKSYKTRIFLRFRPNLKNKLSQFYLELWRTIQLKIWISKFFRNSILNVLEYSKLFRLVVYNLRQLKSSDILQKFENVIKSYISPINFNRNLKRHFGSTFIPNFNSIGWVIPGTFEFFEVLIHARTHIHLDIF